MRKLFNMIAAAAFALSIVAGGCAKEKSPPQAQPQPAKTETSGPTKTTAQKPKPRVKLFTGTIEAMDVAAGTLTLKGPKGEMDFQVQGEAKGQLDDLSIGDKVIVKHIDEIALTIVKPRTGNSALMLEDKRVM